MREDIGGRLIVYQVEASVHHRYSVVHIVKRITALVIVVPKEDQKRA